MQTLETFAPPATAEHLSDTDITAAIELFFMTKKGVPAHLIDVATHYGVVGSTGFAGPPAAWYPGALRPPAHPNSDFALAEHTRTLYFWSASLHNQDVAVLVENGRATLTGTVDTWLDREQAALDAYEAGAHTVDNALLLSTASGL